MLINASSSLSLTAVFAFNCEWCSCCWCSGVYRRVGEIIQVLPAQVDEASRGCPSSPPPLVSMGKHSHVGSRHGTDSPDQRKSAFHALDSTRTRPQSPRFSCKHNENSRFSRKHNDNWGDVLLSYLFCILPYFCSCVVICLGLSKLSWLILRGKVPFACQIVVLATERQPNVSFSCNLCFALK